MQKIENEIPDFEEHKKYFLKFSAEWCSPCRMMEPFLIQIEEENKEEFIFYEVDADANPLLLEYFGIMSIPSFIAIKDGKEVGREVGAQPKAKLEALLDLTKTE